MSCSSSDGRIFPPLASSARSRRAAPFRYSFRTDHQVEQLIGGLDSRQNVRTGGNEQDSSDSEESLYSLGSASVEYVRGTDHTTTHHGSEGLSINSGHDTNDSTIFSLHDDLKSSNSITKQKRDYSTIGPVCIVPNGKSVKRDENCVTSLKAPSNSKEAIVNSAGVIDDTFRMPTESTNLIVAQQRDAVTATIANTTSQPANYIVPTATIDSSFTNTDTLIGYIPLKGDGDIFNLVHSSMKDRKPPNWAQLDYKLKQFYGYSRDRYISFLQKYVKYDLAITRAVLTAQTNNNPVPWTLLDQQYTLGHSKARWNQVLKFHWDSNGLNLTGTQRPELSSRYRGDANNIIRRTNALTTSAAENTIPPIATHNPPPGSINVTDDSTVAAPFPSSSSKQSFNNAQLLNDAQRLQQLTSQNYNDTSSIDVQQLPINTSTNIYGSSLPRGSSEITVTENNGQPSLLTTMGRPRSKIPKFVFFTNEEDARLLEAAAVANATGSRINWFRLGQSLNIGADRCQQRLQHLMGHNNSDNSAANVSAVNMNSTSRKIQEEKRLRDAVRKAHKKNGSHINWELVSHTLKRSISYCKQKWQALSAGSQNTGNNRLNRLPTTDNTTTGASIGSNRFNIITDETPQGANMDNECTISNGAKVLLFTQEHDEMLMSAAAAANAAGSAINWFQISQALNRSAYLCQQRLQQLMSQNYNDSRAVIFDSVGCGVYTSVNTEPSALSASSVVAPNGTATNSLATAPRAIPFKSGRFSSVEDQLILERVPLSLHTSRELFRGFAPLSQELNRPIDVVKNRWMKLYNASRPPKNKDTSTSNVGAGILPVAAIPVTQFGTISHTASSRALPAGLTVVVSSTCNENLTLVHADTNGNVLAANRPSVTTTTTPNSSDLDNIVDSDTNSTAQTPHHPHYERIPATHVVRSGTSSASYTEYDIPNNSGKAAAGACALALSPLQVQEQVSPEITHNIFDYSFVESNCDNYW